MPDLDNETTSKMQPKKKSDGSLDIRTIQLNEKTSETEYQILHPETDAHQVITDNSRKFVSQEQIDKWNNAFGDSKYELHYKGSWKINVQYSRNDVVYYDINDSTRYYYICYNENAEEDEQPAMGLPPYRADNIGDKEINTWWKNIDFSAYLAKVAEQIKVSDASNNADYLLTFVPSGREGNKASYQNSTFKYNPSTKVLTIENNDTKDVITLNGITGVVKATRFQGTADKAEEYVTYRRDTAKDPVIDITGNRTVTGSANIEDKFVELERNIANIEGGNVTLANKLIIQKNGHNVAEYNGSVETTANIEIVPQDVVGLLDSTDKIKEIWLPDSVVGGMQFIGTFNPVTGVMVTDLRTEVRAGVKREFRQGDYAIAVGNGDKDPSGITHTSDTNEATYYVNRDWAVCSGPKTEGSTTTIEWTKVDNTDAVKMVNGQIGDVETFKGNWIANVRYYKGDMVVYNGAVYIAKQASQSATFSEENFVVAGRIYGAKDGIELDTSDYKFKHSFNGASIEKGTGLSSDRKFKVSLIEDADLDEFGHVHKISNSEIQIPDVTWRPVKINDDVVFNSTPAPEKVLTFKDDEIVIPTKDEDNNIIFKHKESEIEVYSSGTMEDGNLAVGGSFNLPIIGWDKYGHIISLQQKKITLDSGLIKHDHFNVADGTIRAYTDAEYGTLTNKLLKFYIGNTIADNFASQMNFNGKFGASELYQVSDGAFNKVLDGSIGIYSGTKLNGSAIVGTFNKDLNRIELADTGIAAGVYTAVAVNRKGIVTAGGQICEFGQTVDADPSDNLVIGGLFFRMVSAAENRE